MEEVKREIILQKLKMLLGKKDKEEDSILLYLIQQAEDFILNHCHVEEIPKGLETTLVNLAADHYRLEGWGKEQVEGIVKSIKEGDISVSYGSFSELNGDVNFLKDYISQLNQYRKAGW